MKKIIDTIKKLDIVNSLFLTLTPVVAVLGIWGHIEFEGLNLNLFYPFLIFYFFTGLSITAGYHRLFSHKAYRTNPLIRLFYLLFGAATFQNSALKWCSDHRIHHQFCDKEKDPYNIKRGVFFAHMGWIYLKETEKKEFAKDLANDPLILWQHKYYVPIGIFMGFIIPTLIGYMMGSPLGGFAIIGVLRTVFIHHMTFFINSLCHVIGKRPYDDKSTSRDSAGMAFFTFGEGYHNFHHKFQLDYRNGIKWYHFDPTKWLIATLAKLNLADHLKITPEEDILKAKMSLSLKKIEGLGPNTSIMTRLEKLSERFENNINKIKLARRRGQLFRPMIQELEECYFSAQQLMKGLGAISN